MQVFGLPGHIIRNGRAASRLLDAESLNIVASRRREILARWRTAMGKGLSAADAARAVGVARATLYRWERFPSPAAGVRIACAPRAGRRPWWRPSSICDWTIRCGASARSPCCWLGRAWPRRSPPSGGSSPTWSSAER